MITISLRTYNSHIKSLLHFNYPYFAEPGDGLTDEIGTFSWSRTGSAKLASAESPSDLIHAHVPRFGYRCLYTGSNSDYVTGIAPSPITLTQFECSCWIYPFVSRAGNIIQLQNSDSVILTLSINADNKLVLASSSPALNLISSETLNINTWYYIRLQVSTSSANISVNNSAGSSATLSEPSLPAFNTINLGGFFGALDEFILRDSFTSNLPTEPVKATIRVNSLGGFGTGALGNVTLTANCVMNTCGAFNGAVTNPSGYSVTNIREGKFGAFKTGDEVMLLNMSTGEYFFTNITSVSGSYYKLNATVPDSFKVSSGIQILQIPNFNSLTINSGVTVSPNDWDTHSGGIVAFRCKGNCTVNGSIITSGKGRPRTDLLQLTHSKLIDTFITNSGGGMFITCGGTFTAGSSARLGATWDGSAKAGEPAARSRGGHGGAGYGGAGAADNDSNSTSTPGGVGGGGGGANSYPGGNSAALPVGSNGHTGGTGIDDTALFPGGTQGKSVNGTSHTNSGSGGGGAGGNSGGLSNFSAASSGASLILIAQTLKADSAAVSTGGEGGRYTTNKATGGGGTGFCYIACERMI